MPTWIAAIFRGPGVGGWGLVQNGKESVCGQKQKLSSPIPNPQSLTPPFGFTLLELTVVLFLVGLLVAIAVPRLGDLGSARLDSSARRLAALVRYLSGEAAFRNRPYRLNYDLDQQTYWVTVLSATQDAAEFKSDPSPLSRPVKLPASITFADVHVPGIGQVSTGQVYTHFFPQGYTDPTAIHLRDQHSRIVTILIPPLTGEARIYEGYVDGFRLGARGWEE